VLERWLIDTSRFPAWPAPSGSGSGSSVSSKAMRDFSRVLAREARSEETRAQLSTENNSDGLAWPDLDEQFRGALRRMAHVAEGMSPLPEGCTFTVAVELDEEGKAPIGVGVLLSSLRLLRC
jgi:mitotic spindle assembly checkpoint protein MAD2B